MNIRCPNCQSVFRVDPARIPPGGVRARCSRCSAAFQISTAAGAAAGATSTTGAPGKPAAAGATGGTGSARPAASTPASGSGAVARPGTGQAAAGTAAPPTGASGAAPQSGTAAPAAGPGAPAGARGPVFGTRDPHARAERIARALVSDIVAYHPKKRSDALAAGTMRTEFREEIMKSWEEYVAQVGAELAKGTPYFRNALNDILAQGQRIF